MGLDIKTEKGSRNAELVSELGSEMQLSIARLYSSFVITNYVLDKTLVKLIEKHPNSALLKFQMTGICVNNFYYMEIKIELLGPP